MPSAVLRQVVRPQHAAISVCEVLRRRSLSLLLPLFASVRYACYVGFGHCEQQDHGCSVVLLGKKWQLTRALDGHRLFPTVKKNRLRQWLATPFLAGLLLCFARFCSRCMLINLLQLITLLRVAVVIFC